MYFHGKNDDQPLKFWVSLFSDNPLARFNEVANVYSLGEAYRRFYKTLIVSR